MNTYRSFLCVLAVIAVSISGVWSSPAMNTVDSPPGAGASAVRAGKRRRQRFG